MSFVGRPDEASKLLQASLVNYSRQVEKPIKN